MAYRKRRKKRHSFFSSLVLILALGWVIYTKGGTNPAGTSFFNEVNQFGQTLIGQNSNGQVSHLTANNTNYGGLSDQDYQKLAKLDFKSGQRGYIILNNDHSTLIKNAWKQNQVIYANLDRLNRTSHSNTAFLEKRNVANDSLRVRQFIQPTAWHYNRRNGVQLYNRGHLIAYSVSAGIDQSGNYNPQNQSGDQNNPKNLFTQTAFSNQKIQTIFESKIRQALRSGKKVIYQATPIFRGSELMARGINLQAISTDGSLDFNVYIFNVQPDFVFNYQNGRASTDRSMQVFE